MKAKDFLKQVKKLDNMIRNKIVERDQWVALASGTTTQLGERVQSSGNQQKMESAICKYVDIEKELDQCIDSLIDKKREIISVIEQLDATEYDFLHKVYIGILKKDEKTKIESIYYLTLDEVADLYGKSHSWATTVHGNALKNVQAILDAREKSIRKMFEKD